MFITFSSLELEEQNLLAGKMAGTKSFARHETAGPFKRSPREAITSTDGCATAV